MELVSEFFWTARERYRILRHRRDGLEFPWTNNIIFREWRFCNVRREDDKTTVWFRCNIRTLLRNKPLEVLKATIIFRWFNRIETGEIIKDLLLGQNGGWNSEVVELRLRDVHPLVTGAYMIKTVTGLSKLDGLLETIDEVIPQLPELITEWSDSDPDGIPVSIREVCEDLARLPFIGRFMAYEIASDLRHTCILREAPDINSWANAGPGCTRGLSRVLHGADFRGRYDRNSIADQEEMNLFMRKLLEMSRKEENWRRMWPRWEMREVEHWLCEFDKYMKVKDGGTLKRKFSHE